MKSAILLLVITLLAPAIFGGWSSVYSLPGEDFARSGYETADGGFFFLVEHRSPDEDTTSALLAETDSSGVLSGWSSIPAMNDGTLRMFPSDDGFYAVGFDDTYLSLVRLDSAGATIRTDSYRLESSDYISDAAMDSSENIVLVGTYEDGGANSILIIGMDSLASPLFRRELESGGYDALFASRIIAAGDIYYFSFTGYFAGYDSSDYALISIDSTGAVLDTVDFYRKYPGGDWRSLYLKGATPSGKAIIVGTEKVDTIYNEYLRILSPTGAIVREVKPLPRDFVYPNYLLNLDDGYLLGGSVYPEDTTRTDRDAALMKVDSLWSMEWTRYFGADSTTELVYHLSETADRGFLLTGAVYDYSLDIRDLYAIRTDSTGKAAIQVADREPTSFSISARPNPFNSSVIIEVGGVGPESRPPAQL